jgi:nicotinate dehydrogenase subunit A
MPSRMTINSRPATIDADPDTPLLYVLRGDLALSGPKFGCGLGQCGACLVLLNGEAVPSCMTTVAAADGADIVTLEGLASTAQPHPLLAAFVAEQAVQCGYCTNGVIVQAAALLRRNPKPSEEQVREALANNLCRCGTHPRVVRAVRRAAQAI